MKPVDEKFVYFRVARLLDIQRRYGQETGLAHFRCWWEDEAGLTLGWTEPMNTDTIHKRGSLKATKLEMTQSSGEIGKNRIMIEAACAGMSQFRLSRRKVKDGYQTFVFFAVRLPDADGCGQLEPFLTRSRLPGSLKIFYETKRPDPVQTTMETANA